MANNTIVLLKKPDGCRSGHGGPRKYRHWQLYINEVLIDNFVEDSAFHNYLTGKSFEAFVAKRISSYKEALACEHSIMVESDLDKSFT